MEYKMLGRTREKLPVLGLGTWYLNVRPNEEIRALRYGLGKGAFIDTAEMYGTEELVGTVIEGRKAFVATKVSPHHFRRDDVIRACDASLKRLGVRRIDLYQLHWPNRRVPISETMSAMERLVDDGKIRHIGVSNFSVGELREAQESMKRHEIVSNQVEYNPLVRDIEGELLGFCKKNKVTVIAYSPLGHGGLLKDKFSGLMDMLDGIGAKHGKSGVQVALNWLISKRQVVAIPKASTVEHVKEILGSIGWSLSKKEAEAIDDARDYSVVSLERKLGFVLKSNGAWAGLATKGYSKNKETR
ncbi:MAG TPA: aldo/keto reductase [Candidatus Baltobacteraceae bacterium]|nr:aldo/keto reductase [Candidatus Baltobacteraceae bacterium]